MDSQRRKKLIKLAVVAVVIDLATTLFEVPFLVLTIGTITLEEVVEQIISSIIARNDIKLTVLDRLIGMIPIPGITPITVAVVRELTSKNRS